MSDLFNQVIFTEATRTAAQTVKRVADKYGIELDSKEMREAMAEMFQEGCKYSLEVIQSISPKGADNA